MIINLKNSPENVHHMKDFERLKKVLLLDLKRGDHILTQDKYNQIPELSPQMKFPVFKIKKFHCKSTKERQITIQIHIKQKT